VLTDGKATLVDTGALTVGGDTLAVTVVVVTGGRATLVDTGVLTLGVDTVVGSETVVGSTDVVRPGGRPSAIAAPAIAPLTNNSNPDR
jgi:hypothetical protein